MKNIHYIEEHSIIINNYKHFWENIYRDLLYEINGWCSHNEVMICIKNYTKESYKQWLSLMSKGCNFQST